MYSTSSSTLVVKNTQDQLDLVERVIEIDQSGNAIKQIEIQAKFVEITQNNLKELSFDWLFGQANVPGISTDALFFSGGTSGTSPATSPADFPFTSGGRPIGGNPVTAVFAAAGRPQRQRYRRATLRANGSCARAWRFRPHRPHGSQLPGGNARPRSKEGVDLLSAPRVTTRSGNER